MECFFYVLKGDEFLLYYRVKELCDKKGIAVSELERAVELGNGTVRKWNNVFPSADRLAKVADYFNVTVDFLLGREPNYAGDGGRPYASVELKESDGKFFLKVNGVNFSGCTKSVEFHHKVGEIPIIKMEVWVDGTGGAAVGVPLMGAMQNADC